MSSMRVALYAKTAVAACFGMLFLTAASHGPTMGIVAFPVALAFTTLAGVSFLTASAFGKQDERIAELEKQLEKLVRKIEER